MITFTREEIEERRRQFEGMDLQEVEETLDGLTFKYFIIPQELNPEFPNFVMRITGESSEDGELYGVADSVEEEFRKYYVGHEVIEFRELDPETPDRCVRALERELALVPGEMKPRYIPGRRAFFETLVEYVRKDQVENGEKHYTANDLSQFERNVLTLRELEERLS